MDTPTRRVLLGSCTALLAALAGCARSDRASGTQTGAIDTARGTDETPMTELDLREANVTEVSIDDRGDGTYRFDVTLYHDVHESCSRAAHQKSKISEDGDGEDGYAN